MLTFELPEIIYKVTKYLDTRNLPYNKLKDFDCKELHYHFKDINLAQEFYRSFQNDYEYVDIEVDGEFVQCELKVLANLDIINTLDIIPHVIDM
jgi:hypothetical protein